MANIVRNVVTAGMDAVEKSAVKATYNDDDPPKVKHVEALLNALKFGTEHDLVQLLVRRFEDKHWNVVLKTLMVIHRLCNEGAPERFFVKLCNSPHVLNLSGFRDTSDPDVWGHSQFIQVYADYLAEKVFVFKMVSYCGERNSTSQNKNWALALSVERICDAMPKVQGQFEKLLEIKPYTDKDDVCHPITKSAFMLLIRDAYKLHSLLYVAHLVVLDTFQQMNLKQCELCLDVCQKYLIQNKRFRDWAQSLVKNNVLPGTVLQDFESLPAGFVGLLEERIKYIKDTGDESSLESVSSKSEHKASDRDKGDAPHKEKKKKKADKDKDGKGESSHSGHSSHSHKKKDKEHHTPTPKAASDTPKSAGIHVPEPKEFDLFASVASQPASTTSFDPFGPSAGSAFGAPSKPAGSADPFGMPASPAFAPMAAPNPFAASPGGGFGAGPAVAANPFGAGHASPFPSPQPTPFDVFNTPAAQPKAAPTANAVDVFFSKPSSGPSVGAGAGAGRGGPAKPRDPFAAIQPATMGGGMGAGAGGRGNPFSPGGGGGGGGAPSRDPFASIDFLAPAATVQPSHQSASLSDLASNPFFSASPSGGAAKPASSQPNPFDPF